MVIGSNLVVLSFIAAPRFALQHLRCGSPLYARSYVRALMYIAATYILIELQVSKNAAQTYVPLSHLSNCGDQSVSKPSILKRITSDFITLKYELARPRIDRCGEHEYTRRNTLYGQTRIKPSNLVDEADDGDGTTGGATCLPILLSFDFFLVRAGANPPTNAHTPLNEGHFSSLLPLPPRVSKLDPSIQCTLRACHGKGESQ